MNAYELVALLNNQKLELVNHVWYADLVNENHEVVAHFCAFANVFAEHRWIVGAHPPNLRQCS